MLPRWQIPTVTARAVADDAHLLDVREPEEFILGHAPGAQHIPMSQLMARVGEVPADRDVVVVCRVGARSARVTAWLAGQGWRVANLEGGMEAWAAAGRPLVSETGLPPYVG